MRAALLILALAAHASAAPAVGARGMVSGADPLAAEIGAQVLRDGGNAADAAAATAFALAVVEPWSSGLGGGGFLLYHQPDAGTTTVLDFREIAPLALSAELFSPGGKYDPVL